MESCYICRCEPSGIVQPSCEKSLAWRMPSLARACSGPGPRSASHQAAEGYAWLPAVTLTRRVEPALEDVVRELAGIAALALHPPLRNGQAVAESWYSQVHQRPSPDAHGLRSPASRRLNDICSANQVTILCHISLPGVGTSVACGQGSAPACCM